MSDMRKKLASVVYDEAVGDDEGRVLNSPDVAAAIIAALPDMVRPLEWVRHPLGWNCEGFMIDARNPKAIYVMRGLYGKPRFDTVEEAKSACQAHHTAAILSALGVAK